MRTRRSNKIQICDKGVKVPILCLSSGTKGRIFFFISIPYPSLFSLLGKLLQTRINELEACRSASNLKCVLHGRLLLNLSPLRIRSHVKCLMLAEIDTTINSFQDGKVVPYIHPLTVFAFHIDALCVFVRSNFTRI